METIDFAATPVAFATHRYKAILRLALPTMFAMLSQAVVNEIDVLYFSRLPCPDSSNAQAALLPSLILVWLFGGSLSAISVGTQALIALKLPPNSHTRMSDGSRAACAFDESGQGRREK